MDPMEAFRNLVIAPGPRAKAAPSAKFVQNLEEIPSVELSLANPCHMALLLSENALICKFTGLWPSPKAVDQWIADRWRPLAPSHISLFAAGRGYFVFNFANKEERNLIFRSGPYFMGSRGLFLAPWSLDFNPEVEITEAPVWVRLPHLPLHLWGKSSLADIGNKLGRFLESAEPKGDQYTCARICVEVNLEKGLPEALQLTLNDWSHIQELDYEHIPFKCLRCHVYGHFAKSYPIAKEAVTPPQVKDANFQPVTNRRRATRRKDSNSEVPAAEETSKANKNSFEVLQEDEVQVPEAAEAEEETSPVEEHPGPPEPVIAADAPKEVGLAEPGTSPSKLVNFESPPSVVSVDLVGKEASLTAAIPAAKKGVRTPEYESPAQEGFIVASLAASCSKGLSGSTSYLDPSPPLTRGRKTTRERRENEAVTNISSGSQKQLDPYIKGRY